ncbi:uncharacterized protein EV154DRAFT_493046 [Mucor mucedo]|uniref:uncharacterized protein n=1 Tax=Mucor mucedo TaxID=29922 RepID=UPI002220A716|nr:uncharacterized protein EV154DRAFT_493046 [Mucor mucedo]KAI7896332.1 hypothetical protein EV154DRAFT_493046 [Mucor mucedo]
MESYSEINKQRIIDLNAKIREMIQETTEILVKEENVTKAEAEASIGFHYTATSLILVKRKSPYNIFTERLAAEKKADSSSGDQPQGSFQREASQLYQALGPEDKAELVKSARIDSNLSEDEMHLRHSRALRSFRDHLTAYNTICGSNFLLLSVRLKPTTSEDGFPTPVLNLFSVGAYCNGLKQDLGQQIQDNVMQRLGVAQRASKKARVHDQSANLLRKEYRERLLQMYQQHPGTENAKAFPYKKLCDGTADLFMRGWPRGIPIKHASEQTISNMKAVLRAVNGNKISFVLPEERMEEPPNPDAEH